MGSVIFTILFGVLNGAWAFAPEVMDVFVQTNQQSYKPLMCSDSIYQLIQNFKTHSFDLQKQGFDLREAEVLLIKHKWVPQYPVLPQKARRKFLHHVYLQYPRWGFHMVLVWQGLVFDFDYTDDLQIAPLDEYMAEMWKAESLPDYRFERKKALELQPKDLFGEFKD